MIKVPEVAVEKLNALAEERQECAAEVLEQSAAIGDEVYRSSEEERRRAREGLDELDRGE